MPNIHPFQLTFEAGELSPLIYSRSDLPGYGKGAVSIRNLIPNTRGSIQSRKGSEFKQTVADPTDTDGRLFTFRYSDTKSYTVAVTETNIWVTDESGLLESENKLANGDFTNGSTSWTSLSTNSGLVSFSTDQAHLTAAGIDGSTAGIKQQITGLTTANKHKIRINGTLTTAANATPVGFIRVGTTEGGSEVLVSSWNGGYKEIEFDITTTSIWVQVDVLSVYAELPPPSSESVWWSVTGHLNYITVIDVVTSSGAGAVSFASPYSADQLRDIQAEMAPDLNEMVFVRRGVSPRKLSFDGTTWSFTAITFTPADPFGSSEYPGALTWHQGRLVFASTDSKPVTLFASKPGRANYYDFTYGTGANADDAIEVTLARNGKIQWVKGAKVLYVGCDNSEHVITSDGPVITPSDIESNQQSAYGSACISSDWLSEEVGFVSYDLRRVRLIGYSSDSERMSSPDITWAAEHLTEAGVTEIHHASNPQAQLFACLQDGSFLSCTYEAEFGTVAWAKHNISGALVRSLTVVEEQGTSVLYALVYANDELQLLRMGEKEIFMDSFLEKGFATATNTVTGLDHLDGETVSILADDEHRADAVVASGQVTVSGSPAYDFVVGLKMSRTMQTMIVDSVRAYGMSTAAWKKRWPEIFVRLHNSAIPKINGRRTTEDTATQLSDLVAATGIQDVKVNNLGWDSQGLISIEQDLPFDLNIVGIFGKLSEERL